MRYVLLMSAVVLAVIATTGCSKGMSPTETSLPVLTPPSGGFTTVSGRASAGPVSNALITAYELDSVTGARGAELTHADSDANGDYTLLLPSSYVGPIEIEASSDATHLASYSEEAGSTSTSLLTPLRVVLHNASSGQYAITPVTEIAAVKAHDAPSGDMSAAIQLQNGNVASLVGLADITTPPAKPDLSGSPSADAKQYALVLAAISQLAHDEGGGATSLTKAADLATSFKIGGTLGVNLNTSMTVFLASVDAGALAAVTPPTIPVVVAPSVSHPIFANWVGTGTNHLTWNFSSGSALDNQFIATLTVLPGATAGNVGDVCQMTVTLNSDNTAIISGSTSISGDDSGSYCSVWNKFDGLTYDNQPSPALYVVYWDSSANHFSFANKDYIY